VFARSTEFNFALIALAFVGLFVVGQVTVANTLLQAIVPDRLRGRVLSMFNLSFMGVLPFGNLFAGSIAVHLGVGATLALGATVVGLYALQAFLRHPEMLKY
jgi:MFS family permease